MLHYTLLVLLYFDEEINGVAVISNHHPATYSPNIHRQFLAVRRGMKLPVEGKVRMQNPVTTVH
jgi:hypothetical protein